MYQITDWQIDAAHKLAASIRLGMSITMRSANGWFGSRWRRYTDCKGAGRTATAASPINLPDPTQLAIGERRKPDPQERPGYLRVYTVHQGDLDGVKGLYHINAVDEVTHWQVVCATAQISEAG